MQGGFKKAPPKVKKPAAKKSSSAVAAAAAAEAKARAAKKGNKKDKSTFNQVGVFCCPAHSGLSHQLDQKVSKLVVSDGKGVRITCV